MENSHINKYKIINDPVYGFIKIPSELAFHIIEHPLFQRLRRIRQLGMTHMVYPGATHTRFQHALGAMHLMDSAIETIKSKGHEITPEEAEAVTAAILLHDIGHGPFSHTLEMTLIKGMTHEDISLAIMEKLNHEFNGRLDLAIQIFRNKYRKKFLFQLVSGQIDVDRLDYLRRDSFYTGVTEGTIGSDRLIKMLEIHNDKLVVEEKGIYSVEKFLVARRLMYWQVYLHKGVLAADQLLILMLERAKELAASGQEIFASPPLAFFLKLSSEAAFEENMNEFLRHFGELDDNDIISAAKIWSRNDDPLLRFLSDGFVNRRLFRIEISDKPFTTERREKIYKSVSEWLEMPDDLARRLVISDSISNHAYSNLDDNIQILARDGSVRDISEVSGILNVAVLSGKIRKYYICYPKKQVILQ